MHAMWWPHDGLRADMLKCAGASLGKDLEVVKSAASMNFPVGLRVWVKVRVYRFAVRGAV